MLHYGALQGLNKSEMVDPSLSDFDIPTWTQGDIRTTRNMMKRTWKMR
jgi:hypothetical protein